MIAPDVHSCYLRMPYVEKGMQVGLFGGSFNPPHAGHRLVAEIALRRLRLDQLWWMVTPGNPLKNTSRLAPLAERMAAARKLAPARVEELVRSKVRGKTFGVLGHERVNVAELNRALDGWSSAQR